MIIIHAYYSCSYGPNDGSGVYLNTYNADNQPKFINCDIVYNEHYGIYHRDDNGSNGSTSHLINTIVFFNIYNQVGTHDQASMNISYSNVFDYTGGTGNLDVNPDFIGYTNFYLEDNSPLIDMGNPDSVYFDVNFPPSLGTEINDIGASGGHFTENMDRILDYSIPSYPTSAFSANPIHGVEFLEVTFTNESNLGNGDLISYEWYFDDGVKSYEENPIHMFNTPGEYKVSLILETTLGTDIEYFTITVDPLVGTDEKSIQNVPISLKNYPNPFNPETTIAFNLKKSGFVRVEIFNIKGQLINSLLNNNKDIGQHTVIWKGIDKYGNSVGSGLYLYKLKVDGNVLSMKKCLFLK